MGCNINIINGFLLENGCEKVSECLKEELVFLIGGVGWVVGFIHCTFKVRLSFKANTP